MRRPSDDHGGDFWLTDDELAFQAIRRDAETVRRWWLALTYCLHFQCASSELPEMLEEAMSEPSEAGRRAA